MAADLSIDLHAVDGALDRELHLIRSRAVHVAEQIDERDRDIESARLLVAVRVFAGVIELYAERRRLGGEAGG